MAKIKADKEHYAKMLETQEKRSQKFEKNKQRYWEDRRSCSICAEELSS
jgi:hypothetical protein